MRQSKFVKETTLLWGGDTIVGFDVAKAVSFFKENDVSVVAGKFIDDRSFLAGKFGVVELDEQHRVLSFEEKPAVQKSNIAAIFFYVIKRVDLFELSLLLGLFIRRDRNKVSVSFL
ncbi:hypothetical protein HY772_08440 [Candidatus Woesearchaeota archaeon]|nr:hypothetical protein [Candidatus Woesearchaeota archaeon]